MDYTVYTTSTGIKGSRSHSNHASQRMSHGDTVRFIRDMRIDTLVIPVWTIFKNKRGETIEKVTFQRLVGGWRVTDVIWINKGRSYR